MTIKSNLVMGSVDSKLTTSIIHLANNNLDTENYGARIVSLYNGVNGYNFQIQNGDFLLENINYRYIEDANSHALRFMQSNLVASTDVSALEIEALALEYELQLKRL